MMATRTISSSKQTLALLLMIFAAFLAIADGLWLTLVHLELEVGKPGASAVCHRLAQNGCEITSGRYGSLLGIPVALIGFAGATATFFTGALAFRFKARPDDPSLAVCVLLGGFSVAASLIMAGISALESSYCPFCVAWYALNVVIAACAWVAWRHRPAGSQIDSPLATLLHSPARFPALVVPAAIFAISLSVGVWVHDSELDDMLARRAEFTKSAITKIKTQPPKVVVVDDEPVVGLNAQGQPAEVTIIEFSDFECPYCRRLWHRMKKLQELSEREIVVVHLNYPLDRSCNAKVDHEMHARACAAARAAECARDAGHFDAYADLLFDNQQNLGDDQLLEYAEQLGIARDEFSSCIGSQAIEDRLQSHLQAGFDLGISGTPTVLINGYPFPANISAPILNESIEVLLDPSIAPKPASAAAGK